MKWVKFVERKNSVLFAEIIGVGGRKELTEKITGCRGLGYDYYLQLDNDVLINEEEIAENTEKLREQISSNGYAPLLAWAEKWEKACNELLSFSGKTSESPVEKKSGQLLAEFTEYFRKNLLVSTSVSTITITIDKVVEEKIREVLKNRLSDESKTAEAYRVIAKPEKENDNEREAESFLKIGEYAQKNALAADALDETAKKMVEEHAREFGWINTARFYGEPWRNDEIEDRLKNALKDDCGRKLAENKEARETEKIEEQKLFAQLRLSAEEKLLVTAARKYVFLRTYRINSIMKAGFIARPFLAKVAEELGIGFFDLIYLTSTEITNWLKNGVAVPKKIIEERKKAYVLLCEPNNTTLLSGKEKTGEFREKYFPDKKHDETSVKGTCACKGFAKGSAKIIRFASEICCVA
ncbi:hypothetical protein HY993_04460 [Candidatus Micrarchaeota archaeon]|nr:hypothetical protein [Candidatus Micrarchaeota archaeon]